MKETFLVLHVVFACLLISGDDFILLARERSGNGKSVEFSTKSTSADFVERSLWIGGKKCRSPNPCNSYPQFESNFLAFKSMIFRYFLNYSQYQAVWLKLCPPQLLSVMFLWVRLEVFLIPDTH
jgi:hypothetical protein